MMNPLSSLSSSSNSSPSTPSSSSSPSSSLITPLLPITLPLAVPSSNHDAESSTLLPRGWGSFASPSVPFLLSLPLASFLEQRSNPKQVSLWPSFTLEQIKLFKELIQTIFQSSSSSLSLIQLDSSSSSSPFLSALRHLSLPVPLSLKLQSLLPFVSPFSPLSPKSPSVSSALSFFWNLDPSFVFINHGAFGLSLSSALHLSFSFTNFIEKQPLRFYDRLCLPLLTDTLACLSLSLTSSTSSSISALSKRDLRSHFILCQNVSIGLTQVIKSFILHHQHQQQQLQTSSSASSSLNVNHKRLRLGPQYSILYLNLAYGSVKKMITFLSQQTSTRILEFSFDFQEVSRQHHLRHDKTNPSFSLKWYWFHSLRNQLIELERSSKTIISVAFFDQITSNSSIQLPLKEIIDWCHSKSIVTIIDGAHGPLQSSFALSLSNLQVQNDHSAEEDEILLTPDVYVGNLHKWFCSPKGCAFLFVSDLFLIEPPPSSSPSLSVEQNQHVDKIRLLPPAFSHGFNSGLASDWLWIGMLDYSNWLTIPALLSWWETPIFDSKSPSTPASTLTSHNSVSWTQSTLRSLPSSDVLNNVTYVPLPFDSSICYSLAKPLTFSLSKPIESYNFLDCFRVYSSQLCGWAVRMLCFLWKTEPLLPICTYTINDQIALQEEMQYDWMISMCCVRLPENVQTLFAHQDPQELQDILYFSYHLEVPIKKFHNALYVRISAHLYNYPQQYVYLGYVMEQIGGSTCEK